MVELSRGYVFLPSFLLSFLPLFSPAQSSKVQTIESYYITKDYLKISFSACFFFRYMSKMY